MTTLAKDTQDSSDGAITYKRIQDRAMDDAREYIPDFPKMPEEILYADSARGIYIPQHFAESVDRSKLSGVSKGDLNTLLGEPDQDYYWDTWASVCDDAILTDSNGQQWTLYQDGDLWLVPLGAYEAWESFQEQVESLDAYEIAYESAEWDWVIYYHRALELCQAVPSSVLNDAEAQCEELDCMAGKDFGLYETAAVIAAQIVIEEIVDAVEQLKEELIDLAETTMGNL